MGWMANTDIQPPTSLRAVLSYIGKYVSKPEKSPTSFTELQALGLANVEGSAPSQPTSDQLLPAVLERSGISWLFGLLRGEADAPSPICRLGRPVDGG